MRAKKCHRALPANQSVFLTTAVPRAPYLRLARPRKISFSWHRSSSASRISLISQMPFADAETVRFSRACRNSVCFAISVLRRAWRKDPTFSTKPACPRSASSFQLVNKSWTSRACNRIFAFDFRLASSSLSARSSTYVVVRSH